MIKRIRSILAQTTRAKEPSYREGNLKRNLQYKLNYIRFNAAIYGIDKSLLDRLEDRVKEGDNNR